MTTTAEIEKLRSKLMTGRFTLKERKRYQELTGNAPEGLALHYREKPDRWERIAVDYRKVRTES